MRSSNSTLNPALIDSVQSLEWIARYLGSGFILGKHASQKLGSGMEFNQFRPYTQGDDLRSLDWKMYAKTGKYFVKMSNIDVDNTLTIHLDNSLSMSYEEDDISKLNVGKILTATLTYIMVQQSDRFAWEAGGVQFVPGGGMRHWKTSLTPLFNLRTLDHEVSFDFLNKGIHLWISDLYMEMEAIKRTLSKLQNGQREVVIFHLLGRKETSLSFKNNTKFVDLETNETLQVNVSKYAPEYVHKLNNHFKNIKRYCTNQGIIYQQIFLDAHLPEVLRSFITHYNFIKSV